MILPTRVGAAASADPFVNASRSSTTDSSGWGSYGKNGSSRPKASPTRLSTSVSRRGRRHKRKPWPSRASDMLSKAFYSHGQRISRHQIRTLLVCSLVICSLFYPAAGIFLWSSKGGPGMMRGDASALWQSLSTPLLDSFASSERRHYNSLRDLRMIWDDADDLRAVDPRDAAMIFSKDTAEVCFSGDQPRTANTEPHPLFPFGGLPDILGDGDRGDNDPDREAKTETRLGKPERQPLCRSVRVEHVFLTTDDVLGGRGSRFGVLDTTILQSALSLQRAIEDHMWSQTLNESLSETSFARKAPLMCIQARTLDPAPSDMHRGSRCLSLSPLDYWTSSMAQLSSDAEPHQTLRNNEQHINYKGVPLAIPSTLSGRWHLFNKFPRAEYLAMTFFLDAEGEGGSDIGKEGHSDAHRAWVQMLSNITGGRVTLIGADQRQSKELLLQFRPSRDRVITIPRVLLTIGYIALVIYISRSLVGIKRVHSRFGLIFTGAIELIIAMIMSISVCSLLGIRLALVPWEIMPFVILVVGSENMFVLTKAMVSTPVSLPVSTRMALGLASVGVSITLTVASDVLLISVIASVTPVAAVREFCIFAICLLIMDWFLQITFFVTILSVDMQRLELADILTQGGKDDTLSAEPVKPRPSAPMHDVNGLSNDRFRSRKSPQGIVQLGARAIWRARTARTASLSLLLALMFGLYLYYGTGYVLEQPTYSLKHASIASATTNASALGFDPIAHLATGDDVSVDLAPWWTHSPSATLWQSINPDGAAHVRLIVEPWSIVSLWSARRQAPRPSSLARSFAGWALFRPRIRAIIWLLKIVFLPISATTALLWVLLLYLLKDTELLEAQRDKDRPLQDNTLWSHDGSMSRIDETFDVRLHQKQMSADVQLIAESPKFLAIVDLIGSISIGPKEPLPGIASSIWTRLSSTLSSELRSQQDVVTSVCLDETLGVALFGTRLGRIHIISLFRGTQQPGIASPSPEGNATGITWLSTVSKGHTEVCATRTLIVAAHSDGSLREHEVSGNGPTVVAPADMSTPWTGFEMPMSCLQVDSNVHADEYTAVALASLSGRVVVYVHTRLSGQWARLASLELGSGQVARSAALLSRGRVLPSPAVSDHSDMAVSDLSHLQSVLIGTNAGILRVFGVFGKTPTHSLDLGGGSISRIMLPTTTNTSDRYVLAAIATRSHIWFVKIWSIGSMSTSMSSSALDTKTSPYNSLSGPPKTPTKLRPPLSNGAYVVGLNSGEDASLRSPTTDLAYPMSTHGSRNRRASSYAMRTERSNGGLDTDSDEPISIAGVTSCNRGSADVVDHYLVGIRRSKLQVSPADYFSQDPDPSRSRWQVFAVDLHKPLEVANGEAKIASASVSLEEVQLLQDLPIFSRSTDAADLLAFADIRQVQSSADKQSLFFAFGNVIGEIVPFDQGHRAVQNPSQRLKSP
ncbi:hypothetical protein K437DRAFT_271841 [Tilletiaria anomala UBC 951]|uniref:SSD domain-containing protein n=1 Tax=Tilletiaria anomala (strain ATCC 24038 / CBS 436.72 / UBC 951) TaxID=1037660 RepID=A0A066WPW6_TILAU|nr:uncharacterized protein K437DRAFT_271841 [Tilletiaria anomala UBC 951]KDN53049.1 hypothetical protein K437DRAFT_271841 [Tilletiaria anomala UBC 951]